VDGLAIALGVGSLLVLPAGLIEGGSALTHGSVLGGGVAVALLSSLIPYSLEIVALRRLSAAAFGLLMSLEPAAAALAGLLVLSQTLSLRAARWAPRTSPSRRRDGSSLVASSPCHLVARRCTASSNPMANPCANIDEPP